MDKVRVITFDAGGTLLFPHPSVGEVYAEVMLRHGVELDPEDVEASFRTAWQRTQRGEGRPVSEDDEKAWWREIVARTLEGLAEADDFDALFDDLWHSFADPHRWRLADGAEALLTELSARGYRIGLLSNWDQRLRTILEGMDLAGSFEQIIISAEVGCEKPDPAIFALTEQRFGVTAAEILHVGDSPHHDVDGARAAGWHVVQLGHSGVTSGEHDVIDALHEIGSMLPDAEQPA